MIFLGAGASKELGIKTMQELTVDTIAKLEKRGYGSQTDEIISCLRRFGITLDFEAIYSVLEGLVNIRKSVKDAGALTAYVSKDLDEIPSISDSDEILKELRLLIYEECSKIERTRLNDALDPLFIENPGLQSAIWKDVASRIVTTNYDMAVELYHWGKNLPLTDGFFPTNNPHVKQFSAQAIPIVKEPQTPYRGLKALIKLHGAIWYFKQGSKIIETTNDPDKIPVQIEIGEQIMIYPTKEKPILRQPHYHFYKTFKEQEWNCLVVIGYSFRDEPVNTTILEQLESREDCTVFVVNPEADEVVQNLPGYERYKTHFHLVPIEFGKKGYQDEFFNAIRPTIESGRYF